ncbi:MAG: sigma-70 family RNA polymerase sigma factor [bacterium]|nr:sigma-70 family RNA polymerase sigma factor [bacterium]
METPTFQRPRTEDVTRILSALERGDENATDELLVVVYQELRRLASSRLDNEPAGQTLQATALVHEAYLRLVGSESPSWSGRGHFFGAAAEAMRRILVERARKRQSLRGGGGHRRRDLEELELATFSDNADLLALDDALTKLAREDEQKARLVKLRFFTGLTIPEAAKILGISRATAERHWSYARAWLYVEMVDD